MYALYIGIFISPIQILVELTEMMQKGLSGFRRFLEVVETEPEIVDAADAKPLKNVKEMSVTRMFRSTIAMMIHRCFRMYPLRYRQENQLRLLDRQEAERRQYAHCFHGFMT